MSYTVEQLNQKTNIENKFKKKLIITLNQYSKVKFILIF